MVCAAFSGMAFQLVPSSQAQMSVLALVPFVAWLAMPDPASTGGCPSCRAPRRRQRERLGRTTVTAATRAGSKSGAVSVSVGWDVSTEVSITCDRCQVQRDLVRTSYVDRQQADTAAGAAVLGRTNAR